MSKSNSKKPIAAAVGAAFVTGVACAGVSSATENPFGMTPLSSGYMQLAATQEGEAAEAMGGSEKMGAEGKCGGEKKPSAEGESGAQQ